MKWLWHSNAPWAKTGYGSQTDLVTRMMQAAGLDVAISAFWGLGGSRMEWGGMRVFPADENWGNTWLPMSAYELGDGDPSQVQVITLMDVWVLTNPLLSTLNLAAWVPIDHLPAPTAALPKGVHDFFVRTKAAPIAMSKYGAKQLAAAGFEPMYVPHAIDTETFRPYPQKDVRARVGLPEDAFVVGMVAANKGNSPPRKAFPQVFEAFARFQKSHTDAVLYLHSVKNGGPNALALLELAELMGVPSTALAFSPEYDLAMGLDADKMPQIFSLFDVLCNPALGEGFGVPIVEAQACGVPVVVNGCTAMPELVGHGWATEFEAIYDPSQGAFWGFPRVGSIVDCLKQAYEDRGGGSDAAREFAVANYDAKTVFVKQWLPILEELARRVEERRTMPEVTLRKRPRPKPVAA